MGRFIGVNDKRGVFVRIIVCGLDGFLVLGNDGIYFYLVFFSL